MHICFLTSEYPKENLNSGGIGIFVQFLARKLVKEDILVTIVGLNNSFENKIENDNGIKVYRIAKSKWRIGKFYQNTKRILDTINKIHHNTPITIVEGSELSFAFFPTKTFYKKIIRLHGGHHFFAKELGNKINIWKSFQEKRSFKKANNYIAVSNYVGEKTKTYLQNDFNFTTIYNAVDTEKFKPLEKSSVKTKSLLFVGTVCEKKGIRELVESIPLIKKEIPDIHLKIVGRDWFFPDGRSYIDYLNTFISDDIKENISIIGAVNNNKIPSYIQEAKICVFPSKMESFGLTLLEALLMNKAVVASKIPPFQEIVEDSNSTVLIEKNEAKYLAKSIIKLLKDKNLITELEENSRKKVLIKFNTENIVNKNIDFYKKLELDDKI